MNVSLGQNQSNNLRTESKMSKWNLRTEFNMRKWKFKNKTKIQSLYVNNFKAIWDRRMKHSPVDKNHNNFRK